MVSVSEWRKAGIQQRSRERTLKPSCRMMPAIACRKAPGLRRTRKMSRPAIEFPSITSHQHQSSARNNRNQQLLLRRLHQRQQRGFKEAIRRDCAQCTSKSIGEEALVYDILHKLDWWPDQQRNRWTIPWQASTAGRIQNLLRQDNADMRLTEISYKIGLLIARSEWKAPKEKEK